MQRGIMPPSTTTASGARLGLEAADAAGARSNICWFYALDGRKLKSPRSSASRLSPPAQRPPTPTAAATYAFAGRSEDAVTDFEAALVDWAASDNPANPGHRRPAPGLGGCAARGRGLDHAAGSGRTAPKTLGVQVNLVRCGRSRASSNSSDGRHTHMTGGFDRCRGVFAGDRTRSESTRWPTSIAGWPTFAGGMARRWPTCSRSPYLTRRSPCAPRQRPDSHAPRSPRPWRPMEAPSNCARTS